MIDDEGKGRAGVGGHGWVSSIFKFPCFTPLAGPAVRNSCSLIRTAIPRSSMRTTRPFIISFKAHAPSNTHGQLIVNSIEPEKNCWSSTSKNTPALLIFRVLPDPRNSRLPNNLYSRASWSGKRWRDRRSNKIFSVSIGCVTTDLEPPGCPPNKKNESLYH